MSRFPLAIEKYMSTVLVVIAPTQPLSEAIRLMRLHEVRHLPVVSKNKVVGILSQRDVYLMQSIDRGASIDVLISEAMTSDPYTVEPDEAIDRVARAMVRKRIGAAIVTHNDRLLGLFTTTDALLAIAALVEDDRVPGPDDTLAAAASEKRPRKRVTKTVRKLTRLVSRSKSKR
jgi:acetoin utilization protein AcuB